MSNDNHHASNDTSPVHFGMAGTFSAEDIHELLGFMPTDTHTSGTTNNVDPTAVAMAAAAAVNHTGHAQYSNEDLLDEDDEDEDGGMMAGTSNNSSMNNSTNNNMTNNNSGSNNQQAAIPEDTRAQARSERKRSREKQRRNDVNKQFAELTEVLKRIEAEESSGNTAATAAPAASAAAAEGSTDSTTSDSASLVAPPSVAAVLPPFSSPSNRVELIARTIAHLERLHALNMHHKSRVATLSKELQEAKKAGEETAQKVKELEWKEKHLMLQSTAAASVPPKQQVSSQSRSHHSKS